MPFGIPYLWLCSLDCLAAAGADATTGINVIAAFLHTHLAGVSVYTNHSRGGKQLGYMGRNGKFSKLPVLTVWYLTRRVSKQITTISTSKR